MKQDTVFLTFVLMGASLLTMLLLTGHGVLSIFASAIIILLYFVYIFRHPDRPNMPDESFNSIYYMGFFFTLVSLLASLLKLDDINELSQILQNFSASLVSTVFGLFFRQFLILKQENSKSDKIDPVADAIERCTETSIKAITQASEEMIKKATESSSFHTISDQVKLLEQSIGSSINTISEKLNETVRNMCDSNFQMISESNKKLSLLQSISKNNELDIMAIIDKVKAAIAQLELKGEALRKVGLVESVSSLSTAVSELTNNTTHSTQDLQHLMKLYQQLFSEGTNKIEKSFSSFSTLEEHFAKIGNRLLSIEEALIGIEHFSVQIENYAGNVNRLNNELRSHLDLSDKHKHELEKNLLASSSALEKTVNTLKIHMEKIKEASPA